MNMLATVFLTATAAFHTVVETPRGWSIRAGDGRLWRAKGIEKANGYGPDCGSLGRPYAATLEKAGLSRADWCAQTAERLSAWGFNLLGTACDPQVNADGRFAATEMIALSSWMRDCGPDYLIAVDPASPCDPVPNVFHPDFPAVCDRAAKACCEKRRGETNFLGYYLDNELNWWGCGDWWSCGLMDAALEKLPSGHPARTAAERLLAKVPSARVPDRATARRLYTRQVAEKYFSTIVAAIRKYDPDHLILGCRFAGVAGAPDEVWAACGRHCDVVSLNCYPTADLTRRELVLGVAASILPSGFAATAEWTPVPLDVMLARRFAVAKKPLFISEWSFRGGDVGRPRAESNGQQLATQPDRAAAVSLFLEKVDALPYVVGQVFYMWCDERFAAADGGTPETLNWGLVSLENAPHEAVTAAFRAAKSRFGFPRLERAAKGWTLFDAADRPWKILAIEKANGRGPVCEARGGAHPYAENLKAAGVSSDDWLNRTAAHLRDWGFNALGTSCDDGLKRRGFAYTEMLAFGARLAASEDPAHYVRPWRGRCCEQLPNVFHPQFAAVCDAVARTAAAKHRGKPNFIGYYLDNELNWWGEGDWHRCGLLDWVLKNLPSEHGAYVAGMRVLERHGQATAASYLSLSEAARDPIRRAYTRLFAETYFRTAVGAIRKYDPDHLVLGCRFAGVQGAPEEVWRAAGRWCDVVSFNCYPSYDAARDELTVRWHERKLGAPAGMFRTVDADAVFARLAAVAGRPLFVTEWSFVGKDAGLPCTTGCGQRLATQAERAAAVAKFLGFMRSRSELLGGSWFMWTDDPPEGVTRASPEDCNYGLVNDRDEPYRAVTEAFRRAALNPRKENER